MSARDVPHLIVSLNNLFSVCVVVFVVLELVLVSPPQAYAKFTGAKLTVCPVDWTWKTLTGEPQQLNSRFTVTVILVFIQNHPYHTFWKYLLL